MNTFKARFVRFHAMGGQIIAVARWVPSLRDLSRRANLTISNNMFTTSYKGILLGGLDSDATFKIAASLYRNRFVGVSERQPRVGKSYAHVFNNVYEDWRTRAVYVASSARTIIEQNVFRAVTQSAYAWSVATDATDASLWAMNNVFSSNVDAAAFTTAGFPNCDSLWYYPCDTNVIDVAKQGYSDALNTLRAFGGWQKVANDVR